jgi:hypothetical protein
VTIAATRSGGVSETSRVAAVALKFSLALAPEPAAVGDAWVVLIARLTSG